MPILIAHRGAASERPEHTLAAYRLAIREGADFIEPDLVATKDGALVARHENDISTTTDVAEHPEFAARRRRQPIDGTEVDGWFSEDFTLAELKTLFACERLPELRPDNRRWNGQERIPTLKEILDLVRAEEKTAGRRIGIYPETKHPGHFRALGLPLEPRLVGLLSRYGYREAGDPAFIQSFEIGNLKDLRQLTKLRLIQLLDAGGGPADTPGVDYDWMATAPGLAAIRRYADGIGVNKDMIIPRDEEGRLGAPTKLVGLAHVAGLAVHAWTFRPENHFLPTDFRHGSDPAAHGDPAGEMRAFLAAGIDGLFSESVPAACAALGRSALP